MNELTTEERDYIFNLWPKAPITADGKRQLKLIKYMSKNEISLLCYWVDPTPFHRLKPAHWHLTDDYETIILRGDLYAFHIDTSTGNVCLYLDGRASNLGNYMNALQYYMKYSYAFPVYMDKAHWANGKSPFELGLAVPDLGLIHDALNTLYGKDASAVQQWLFDKKLYGVDLTNINVFEQELTEINKQICNKR